MDIFFFSIGYRTFISVKIIAAVRQSQPPSEHFLETALSEMRAVCTQSPKN
jgi:hypothetical protein